MEPIRDLHLKTMASDRFQCQVDGMPFPSVKFMKDWRPLTETSRQKVSGIERERGREERGGEKERGGRERERG